MKTPSDKRDVLFPRKLAGGKPLTELLDATVEWRRNGETEVRMVKRIRECRGCGGNVIEPGRPEIWLVCAMSPMRP